MDTSGSSAGCWVIERNLGLGVGFHQNDEGDFETGRILPMRMIVSRQVGVTGLSLVLLISVALADGPEPSPSKRQEDQSALKTYGSLVGSWKGTAQPQRGNAKGAWTETGDWAWKLTADSAALELVVGKGKLVKSMILRPGKEKATFALEAALADGSTRSFTGKPGARDALPLVADEAAGEGIRRITLTPLHDTRFLILLEGQSEAGSYYRLAEVGYTRQGVAFAAGESGPICVVTGGRGTTQVSYQGKTYFVCCSGCKDLFYEDPKGVLADFDAKQKAKAK